MSNEQIATQFNQMRQEMTAIAQKLGELEMEREEHQ
jgi:prefoldin subunit 2